MYKFIEFLLFYILFEKCKYTYNGIYSSRNKNNEKIFIAKHDDTDCIQNELTFCWIPVKRKQHESIEIINKNGLLTQIKMSIKLSIQCVAVNKK